MGEQMRNKNEFESFLNSYKTNRNSPIRTLLYLYKGNIKKLAASVLFFIVKNSPVWIIPVVTANIIDIASNPSKYSIRSLYINLLIALVAILQNIPTHMLHIKYFSQAVRYVESELRSTLVRKLQQLSISYHKDLETGKLQSKVLRDVEAIQFLSGQVFSTLLPVTFNIAVALAVTLSKSLKVGLFFLLTIPVSFLLIKFFRKNIRETNREFRKEIEEMSSKVSEMVEMVPVTRAHALENIEINRIDNQLYKVRERGYRLDIITALFGASSWVTFQTFQILCLAFTGYLAFKGNITVGDVVLYQSYFTSILNQVSGIINIYPGLVKGIESIKSVGEIILAEDIEDNRGKQKLKEIDGTFDFKNVEFKYKDSEEPILDGFNLEVKKGECIAFVGESGAGKTTILNLLIGFNKPTKGEILIDGINMDKIDLRSYRKFLAVVPQNNLLFSGTIKDNITYGLPDVSEEKLKQIIEYANLREFIDKLPEGVNTKIGEHGGKLSGGQRQRISIARALIRDPQIIVLDEATSALDNISELEVQKAMNNLIKGRTTFIVAHRLSTIRDADRIVVVKDGICAECGTYEELINIKGEFYNLKSLQG